MGLASVGGYYHYGVRWESLLFSARNCDLISVLFGLIDRIINCYALIFYYCNYVSLFNYVVDSFLEEWRGEGEADSVSHSVAE